MTTNDAVARLTAGLARDEAIAQAALQGPARLEPDWGVVVYEVDLDSRRVQTVADSSGVFIAPELGRQSEHIARQNPKATLDRVEALREALAEHLNGEGFCTTCRRFDEASHEYGSIDWPCPTVRALASIYTPEPTEERS